MQRWWSVGFLLFALLACWSAAIPLMGSPDEPSHVIKAAAVARGQWSGELGPPPEHTLRPGAATLVQLPADYAAALTLPNCFAFRSDVPASCQQDLEIAGPELVPVETFAGQYPPLYYVLVGWPSLFLGVEASIYAMRLVSALLTAGLLTWGCHRLTRIPDNRTALWGAVAAVTPMTLFLGATVNPQGLEISLAFSFWAACLALVARRGTVTGPALIQAAVSGALLVNVRTSAPFWAIVIVVVTLVLAPPGRWRELLAHRYSRWVGGLAAAASVTAVTWVAVHRDVVTGGDLYPQFSDLRLTLFSIAGRTNDYALNMVGNFGWLDAPAPALTTTAWYIAVGSLSLAALALDAPPRKKAALVGLMLAVLAAPFAFQIPTATNAGLIWQGRYALPIAIGIPIIGGILLGEQTTEVRVAMLRLARATIPVFTVGHVAAFYWASRRYSVGLEGEFITFDPDWSSPIGYLTGTATYSVVALTIAVIVWRSMRPEPLTSSTTTL